MSLNWPKVWSKREAHSSVTPPSFYGEDRPGSLALAGWRERSFILTWSLNSLIYLSRGTRCITAVLPQGRPRAERVTLPWRKRPWYISLRISALETASSRHSSGQLSKTFCAMSPALSLGEKRYSLVLPLTRMSRRLILSAGTLAEPSTGMVAGCYSLQAEVGPWHHCTQLPSW